MLPDIVDDRMDVVCRGTMGMTIGCARCHNHKFDPIPTKDYYSLYSIFANSPDAKRAAVDWRAGSDRRNTWRFSKQLQKRKPRSMISWPKNAARNSFHRFGRPSMISDYP